MDDEYVEAVLSIVEQIPPGHAMSYGAVADAVAESLGRGGPRQVGLVMARFGGGVPWWRIVAADGRLPPGKETKALRELVAEGTPLRDDRMRVDMRLAGWHPRLDQAP